MTETKTEIKIMKYIYINKYKKLNKNIDRYYNNIQIIITNCKDDNELKVLKSTLIIMILYI